METGTKVLVTPKHGQPYTAWIRSAHEDGYTVWLDAERKDDGEVRQVVTSGEFKDASIAEDQS